VAGTAAALGGRFAGDDIKDGSLSAIFPIVQQHWSNWRQMQLPRVTEVIGPRRRKGFLLNERSLTISAGFDGGC
jgi:hypothetical protein